MGLWVSHILTSFSNKTKLNQTAGKTAEVQKLPRNSFIHRLHEKVCKVYYFCRHVY